MLTEIFLKYYAHKYMELHIFWVVSKSQRPHEGALPLSCKILLTQLSNQPFFSPTERRRSKYTGVKAGGREKRFISFHNIF